MLPHIAWFRSLVVRPYEWTTDGQEFATRSECNEHIQSVTMSELEPARNGDDEAADAYVGTGLEGVAVLKGENPLGFDKPKRKRKRPREE